MRLSQEEIDIISRKYLTLMARVYGYQSIVEAINDKWDNKVESGSLEDIAEFKNYQNYCMGKFAYMVKYKAAKYRKFSNHPDLEQDGFEAMLCAFESFNPEKGCFSWWAKNYISTKISRAANAHSTIRFPIKKAKKLKPYKTNTIPIMIDQGASPCQIAENSEDSVNIKNAIETLSDSHKNVVNMTYGFNGVRERAVGKVLQDLELTRPQYAKLLREAQDQIRQQLVILK